MPAPRAARRRPASPAGKGRRGAGGRAKGGGRGPPPWVAWAREPSPPPHAGQKGCGFLGEFGGHPPKLAPPGRGGLNFSPPLGGGGGGGRAVPRRTRRDGRDP